MVKQVVDGDGFPTGRGGWVMLFNGVVELEFALLNEAENGQGGELFGDGANAEFGFWGIRDLLLGLGESERFSVKDLALFSDQHAADESAGIDVGLNLDFEGR